MPAPSVGLVIEIERTVTAAIVEDFAQVSGDTNPVHLDDEYAASTRFGRRIAHGMLAASYISSVLGTSFRGSVYLSQSLRFLSPIYIDDSVIVRVEVTAVREDKPIVTLRTTCTTQDGRVAVDGEALLLVSSAAAS